MWAYGASFLHPNLWDNANSYDTNATYHDLSFSCKLPSYTSSGLWDFAGRTLVRRRIWPFCGDLTQDVAAKRCELGCYPAKS